MYSCEFELEFSTDLSQLLGYLVFKIMILWFITVKEGNMMEAKGFPIFST